MLIFPSLSPELFSVEIMGYTFALRWYALSYLVGFLVAYYLMRLVSGKSKFWPYGVEPLDREQLDGLLTYLILGVIVGGRLGYVFFYDANHYLQHPDEIIRVWDGGMSFHGGFLGVIIAVYFYSRRNGILLWSCADLIALSAPPGLFLGRVANFVNAELWGRPTDMPWGVVFPGARAQDCPNIEGMCARHPSQLYEAGLEGFALFIVMLIVIGLGALRRPGFVSGVFFLGYGGSRYFVEFYRVPDPQFFSSINPYGFAFQVGEYGITMGQMLSLPMIFIGLLLCFTRRPKGIE